MKNKIQGLDIIEKADRKRYGELLTGIRDKFALGLNVYPTNLNKGYNLLREFRKHIQNNAKEGWR